MSDDGDGSDGSPSNGASSIRSPSPSPTTEPASTNALSENALESPSPLKSPSQSASPQSADEQAIEKTGKDRPSNGIANGTDKAEEDAKSVGSPGSPNDKEGLDGGDDQKQADRNDEQEEADESKGKSGKDSDVGSGDEDEAGPSKRRRVVMSSDDEEDDASSYNGSSRGKGSGSDNDGDNQAEEKTEVGVGELMTNIFGEESDDDEKAAPEEGTNEVQEYDEDEPRYIRDEDDKSDDGKVWDFDEMMRSKKLERKHQRRRRRDGSIYIGNDADEQIRMLTDAMKAAAKDDRHSNMERKPALQKRKMLGYVKAMLIKHDLVEAIIDNGMLSAVSEWLAPLPDKSLPALEVRTDLLKILQDYSRLEQGTLKQSGLGRAVMLLYKHPKETKQNKALAQALISAWSRPIFQLDTDFRSMTKEERMQRDYSQLPEAKRQRLGRHETTSDVEKEPEPRVGDKGFIMRARVPRPSQKDYVIRPKSNVEGQFRGATKNRQNSRFDRTQRDFKERTKQQRAQRAVGVSIEGRKMAI